MDEITLCREFSETNECKRRDCPYRHGLNKEEIKDREMKERMIQEQEDQKNKTLEDERLMKLCAIGKEWQGDYAETLKVLRDVISDSLINIIMGYHIVIPGRRGWGYTLANPDALLFDVAITPASNECSICYKHHYNYSVSISLSYLKFTNKSRRHMYQLICPNCFTPKYLAYEQANSSNKDAHIAINDDGKILIDWNNTTQIKWDDQFNFHALNDVTFLRSIYIDKDCRIYPISEFDIEHRGVRLFALRLIQDSLNNVQN